MRNDIDDIGRLRSCLNNLVSLMALPAMWTGSDPPQVLGILLDILSRMLELDFVYARLNATGHGEPIELCRIPSHLTTTADAEKIGRTLDPWIEVCGNSTQAKMPNPEGKGQISIACAWLGIDQERGVLVAASKRNAFPTDTEGLLLRTAVNQAVIELQRGEVLAHRDRAVAVEHARNRLLAENSYLREELEAERCWRDIVGSSKALQDVLRSVRQVAPTTACVLIQGETGTGKELIARAIHRLSGRKQNAFVKLNCAAIPTGLLEAELFGHEKGAFTGAVAQRVGRFELAHHGTLFLDEVGEIPLELQAKLLRVLQEQEFERLGSTRTLRVDTRLIAASNRNLPQMVAAGHFRSDLYYRLNVFPISVPPLRERVEDIPHLARYFVKQQAQHYAKIITEISDSTMNALCRYPWPGNVREMANLIERGVILSQGPALELPLGDLKPRDEAEDVNLTLVDFEREHIVKALQESQWVISGPNGAAAKLGMKRTTLQYKMQKLGITRPT